MNFVYNLYTENEEHFNRSQVVSHLTLRGFMVFEEVLAELKPIAKKQNDKVEMIEVNRLIREKLNIYTKIASLLYEGEQRFVKKPTTNQQILNPELMGPIKEYITLKKLVCDSSPPSMSGLIEYSLIVSFAQQVRCRCNSIMSLESNTLEHD